MELICIFTVFNKASGLYGLLALITGAPISPWQVSMYLHSIVAAAVCAYSLRHIKAGPGSTLQVVSFAWFYLFDTLVNFGYTALFATSWFLVLSQQQGQGLGGGVTQAMNDTAGFTHPTHTVSSVTVVVPTGSADGGQGGTGMTGTPASGPPALGETVLYPEQIPSIVALVGILMIKVYFILVVFAYARVLVAKVESNYMASYSGWQRRAYAWMTRGTYWEDESDLRLSKSRSSQRNDPARR